MPIDKLLHLSGKNIEIDGYVSYLDFSIKDGPYAVINTKDMAKKNAYFTSNNVCVINDLSPKIVQRAYIGQEMKVRGIAYVTQVDGPCTIIQLL